MRESEYPMVLWDYCAKRRATSNNLTTRKMFILQGQNPYTANLGNEGNISNICNFKWFKWMYYREGSTKFPLNQELLGKVLSTSKNVGIEMAQCILIGKGTVVTHRYMRHLNFIELNNNLVEEKNQYVYLENITANIGNSMVLPPVSLKYEDFALILYEDENTPITHTILENDPVNATGQNIMQHYLNNNMINAEVLLPHGELDNIAMVISRAVDDDGKLIGSYNDIPILIP